MKRSAIPHFGADDADAVRTLQRAISLSGTDLGTPAGIEEQDRVRISIELGADPYGRERSSPEEILNDMTYGRLMRYVVTVMKNGEQDVDEQRGDWLEIDDKPVLMPFPVYEGSNIFVNGFGAHAVRASLSPVPGAYVDEDLDEETGERANRVSIICEPGGMMAARYVFRLTRDENPRLVMSLIRGGNAYQPPSSYWGRADIETALETTPPEFVIEPDGGTAVAVRRMFGGEADHRLDAEALDAIEETLGDERSPERSTEITALNNQHIVVAIDDLRYRLDEHLNEMLHRCAGEPGGIGEVDLDGSAQQCASRIVRYAGHHGHEMQDLGRKWFQQSRAVRLSVNSSNQEEETEQGTVIMNEAVWNRRANELMIPTYNTRHAIRPDNARIEAESRTPPANSFGFLDPANNPTGERTGLTAIVTEHAAVVREGGRRRPALLGLGGDGQPLANPVAIVPGLTIGAGQDTAITVDGQPVEGPPQLLLSRMFYSESAFDRYGSGQRNAHGRQYHEQAIAPRQEPRDNPLVVCEQDDQSQELDVHTFSLRVAVIDGDFWTHEDAVVLSDRAARAMQMTIVRQILAESTPEKRIIRAGEERLAEIAERLEIPIERMRHLGGEGFATSNQPLAEEDVLWIWEVAPQTPDEEPTYEVKTAGAAFQGGRIGGGTTTIAGEDGIAPTEVTALQWSHTHGVTNSEKASNQYGIKGMAEIWSDDLMVQDADGNSADMLLSGGAVTARLATAVMHHIRMSAAAERAIPETRNELNRLADLVEDLPFDTVLRHTGNAEITRLVDAIEPVLEHLSVTVPGTRDLVSVGEHMAIGTKAELVEGMMWLHQPLETGETRIDQLKVRIRAGTADEEVLRILEALRYQPGEENLARYRNRTRREEGREFVRAGAMGIVPIIINDLHGNGNYAVAGFDHSRTDPRSGQVAKSGSGRSDDNPNRAGKMEISPLREAGLRHTISNLIELSDAHAAHVHDRAHEEGIEPTHSSEREAQRNVRRMMLAMGMRSISDTEAVPMSALEIRNLATGQVRSTDATQDPESREGSATKQSSGPIARRAISSGTSICRTPWCIRWHSGEAAVNRAIWRSCWAFTAMNSSA